MSGRFRMLKKVKVYKSMRLYWYWDLLKIKPGQVSNQQIWCNSDNSHWVKMLTCLLIKATCLSVLLSLAIFIDQTFFCLLLDQWVTNQETAQNSQSAQYFASRLNITNAKEKRKKKKTAWQHMRCYLTRLRKVRFLKCCHIFFKPAMTVGRNSEQIHVLLTNGSARATTNLHVYLKCLCYAKTE